MTTNTLMPSTQWQESMAPDEAAQFERYAKDFAEMQQRKSAQFGKGRTLHRKQLLGARVQLQVLPNLPEFAAHGLFAQAKTYDGWLRLSNGGMDKAADKMPDIRGFSLALDGVQGDSALGHGPATRQCFALIHKSKFDFPNAAEFIEFVLAASHGPGHLIKFLVRRYGLWAGPKRLLKLLASLNEPFSGFANESFYSAAPIACGPYAVRVRVVPEPDNGAADPAARQDWGADIQRRLRRGPLHYRLELQPYTDPSSTPIEDASIDWPTPYTTVARLTVPQQDISADPALSQQVESGIFDPWAALAEHRPLGNVMRARKVMYFVSQQGRGAA